MDIRAGIELAALSDVGCQRDQNQDSFSYWEPAADDDFRRKGRLVTIADGMGGYEGGKEASSLAVRSVEEVYSAGDGSDIRGLLLGAIQAAHAKIQDYAMRHPALHGMGTTCTAMAVREYELFYAHVGDSRLYLSRQSKIYQLSRDQSYVGRLVDQGIISPEEAGNHPQRHILTSALGVSGALTPEAPEQSISLESGDVLVLCTDGLWSLVSDAEIQQATDSSSLDKACASLVQAAKDRGGPDNITVQMVRVS